MVLLRAIDTFSVIDQCVDLSYDPLILDSMDDFQSQVTIDKKDLTIDRSRAWLIKSNDVWYVDEISPEETRITLTLYPVWKAFARDIIYDGNANFTTKGEFIASIIQSEFIEQADRFYAMPYLEVTSSDSTIFEPPADEAGDIYSFEDYIETSVISDGLWFNVRYSASKLTINISDRPTDRRVVVYNDGHTIYESITISNEGVGKVTVLQNGETTDFYLDPSGDMSMTPGLRVNGDWRIVSIGDEDDPIVEAAKIFSDNLNDHKVEWRSDYDMNVGDTVSFRFEDGSVMQGTIVSKSLKSSDSLYHYKSGKLRTTLTDKVRSVM